MRLTSFNIKTWMKAINELLAFKDSLRSGDGLIQVIGGNSFKINVDRLRARIPKVAGAGNGSAVRSAFCQEDATANTQITCFLDTDATGEEVEVYCSICGGSALNEAIPRLTDGERIAVYRDGDYWWCCTTFQATEDCE